MHRVHQQRDRQGDAVPVVLDGAVHGGGAGVAGAQVCINLFFLDILKHTILLI